jgi:hypothetical protein
MKTKVLASAFAVWGALWLLVTPGNAAVTIFTGTDAGANSTDPRPNSDAAAADFDAAAALLGTTPIITFEGSPLGAFVNLVVATGVSINGTDATGVNQTVVNAPVGTPDRVFGYNTTAGGTQFVSMFGGNLVFTFAQPIQSFGAYLSGVQLDGESITFSDGTDQSVPIPNPGGNGGVSFVGFIEAGKDIFSVTINVPGDIVGIDDVRYGPTSAPPETAPEPSAMILALMAAPLLAGACRHRRKRAAA